jgi:diguanylate cyclase (GGDEF)-like protein
VEGWLDLPVAVGAALLCAVCAGAVLRERRRPPRAGLCARSVSRGDSWLLDALRDLIGATRESPFAVCLSLERALKTRLPELAAVALFERSDDRLRCVYTSGERAERLEAVTFGLDQENLVVHAVRLRYRALAQPPQRGLDPSHRVSLAIPLVAAAEAEGAVLLVFAELPESGAIEEAVAVVDRAAPLYLLAREREGDRASAMLDGLTGLLTPAAFRMLLRREIERARSVRSRRLALLFVDTDHFKDFNDTHGHAAGDALLRRLAALLQECAESGDIVARNGGDEFCLVFVDAEKTQAVERAVRLGAEIAQRATLELQEAEHAQIVITASIGVAAFPADGASAQALLERADAAMYFSKHRGRNRVSYYDLQGELAEA